MSLEWRAARSTSLAWSNPVTWWWGLLTLVSGVNIAVWFLLYHQLHQQPAGGLGSTSGIGVMLLLCAAYVFGCAFSAFNAAKGWSSGSGGVTSCSTTAFGLRG